MRAARLIKMVLLLQSRPAMTAGELARELEVSERTVVRDAQALSEAGVPVYADRGRTGGYRLVGGYRTRLTGLARGEAEALFLSGVPQALREMGLADTASAARLKVSAALLPALRDASRTAAQRFHLDAPAWFREPETPPLLHAIAQAVWDDRVVTARYRRGTAEAAAETERVLHPYGLVLKAGVWYLCARVADDGPASGPLPADAAAEARSPDEEPTGTEAREGAEPGVRTSGDGGSEESGEPTGPARSERAGQAERPGQAGQAGRSARSVGARGASGAELLRAPAAGSGSGSGAEVAGHGRGSEDHGVRRVHRVYRVERFTSVRAERERFVRDTGFDLPGFWAERAEEFARSILRDEVVVRLSEEGVRRLPYAVDPAGAREALAGAGAPDSEGRVTVTLPVESEEVAYVQLMALGPEAEVLAPAALRARCAADARRAAALYDGC